jgi:hypothetical protein
MRSMDGKQSQGTTRLKAASHALSGAQHSPRSRTAERQQHPRQPHTASVADPPGSDRQPRSESRALSPTRTRAAASSVPRSHEQPPMRPAHTSALHRSLHLTPAQIAAGCLPPSRAGDPQSASASTRPLATAHLPGSPGEILSPDAPHPDPPEISARPRSSCLTTTPRPHPCEAWVLSDHSRNS